MRKAISKKTRFEIFKRDSFTCQYCGAAPPKVILHIDHIVPVAEGGGNDMDNLLTSCEACNLGKSANPLTNTPKTLQDKAEEVSEREEQLLGYNAVLKAVADRLEDNAWAVASALEGVEYVDSFNRKNLLSIKNFLKKLPLQEVLDAAEIAFTAHGGGRRFRYFCGICWNRIREQEHAR